jgi:hypothetical protein
MRIQRLLRRGALGLAATGIVVMGMTGAARASGVSTTVTADSARTATVVSYATQTDKAGESLRVSDCTAYLRGFGYGITLARSTWCAVAAARYPNVASAQAACTGGLVDTGVDYRTANNACARGTWT